jgi:putative oxidoreductase
MKKLFTIAYSAGAFNFAMLFLRVASGLLMIPHGYDKIRHFEQYRPKFVNFFGLGSGPSLALDIFAEFFCALLVILGLFTRMATIPLIIAMAAALFIGHNGEIFGDGEHPALYIAIFTTILFVGPGKASVDALIK